MPLPLRIKGIKLLSNVTKKKVVNQNKARELIGLPSIQVELRYCLDCNSPFESVGNRICNDCKSKED